MRRALIVLLGMLVCWGCTPIVLSNSRSLGGRLRGQDTLYTSLDRDFPELWNTSIYTLHKREYEVVTKDRESKRLVASKQDGVRVIIQFTNPVEETTEIRIKVYKDNKIDFEEASKILYDISRSDYHPSLLAF